MSFCISRWKWLNSGVCSNSFGSITSYRLRRLLWPAPERSGAFPSAVGVFRFAGQFLVRQSTPYDLLGANILGIPQNALSIVGGSTEARRLLRNLVPAD
jgi:hypothetical protein